MDKDWSGSTNDSTIWQHSLFKPEIEANRAYLLAGDSGFPISDVLIKPYTNEEAMANSRYRLFNLRLSGLRTVMSENIYGMWKRRFPILKRMGEKYVKAKMTIDATAILHNILLSIGDETPDPDSDEEDDRDEELEGDQDGQDDYRIVADNATREVIRIRGQERRDQLCTQMPPATRAEKRRLRVN